MSEKKLEIYDLYNQIKTKLENLDWKGLKEFDENLALAVRIIEDYHYREYLAGNSEELQKLYDKMKKAGEEVVIGQVGVSVAKGLIGGLVSAGILSAGLASGIGTVLGAIALIGSIVYQPAKAISLSGSRMDDLGHRIDRIRGTRGKLGENIYWKGLDLLHSRPKCRAMTSGCANEHLRKSAEVDLFNVFTDFLISFYDSFSFEKFKEQYNLAKVQEKKQEQEIKALTLNQEKQNYNIFILGGIIIIFLALIIFAK